MKPKVVNDIDYSDVISACEEYIEYISSEEYHEDGLDNFEHTIFEKALVSVYGEKVFDHINDVLE